MSVERPVSEEDLQAYVDEALAAPRRAEIQDYLGRHPDEADRIAGYVAQRRALRAALKPLGEEPVPPGLNLAALIEARRRHPNAHPWRSVAAAVLLLGLGSLGGWLVRGISDAPRGGIAALAQEAEESYRIYALDKSHPVEITAAEHGELVRWISDRLRHAVAIPDLAPAGYRFMGGRLVATPHGPAALYLYDDDRGTRLAVLVRPMAVERDTPMSEHADGPVAGFTWADRGIGYSLVAAAPSEVLHPLADEVRRQAERTIDG